MPREERRNKPLATAPQKAEEDPPSRLAKMRSDGIEPEMPPIELPLMVTWFLEVGPTEAAGMGSGPVSWTSLRDWQAALGIELSAWEVQQLRRMSLDYLGMAEKAKRLDCPSPWGVANHEANRSVIASKIGSIFGARARAG